jgi:hypothetical protein
VAFAGVISLGEPLAGQALLLEWRRDEVFGGVFIPEQDLEFLTNTLAPPG